MSARLIGWVERIAQRSPFAAALVLAAPCWGVIAVVAMAIVQAMQLAP